MDATIAGRCTQREKETMAADFLNHYNTGSKGFLSYIFMQISTIYNLNPNGSQWTCILRDV